MKDTKQNIQITSEVVANDASFKNRFDSFKRKSNFYFCKFFHSHNNLELFASMIFVFSLLH